MKLKNEILGKVFGKLTVVDFIKYDGKHYYYNCICSCGNTHVATRNNLLKNNTNKCLDCSRKNKKHSIIKDNKYTYNSYRSMLLRCFENIRYVNVPICDRWLDKYNGFKFFIDDMGARPENTTLDRIDNSLGYFPENCRWATVSIQNHNKRKRKDSVCNYIGISYRNGKFVSQLVKDGKRIHHRYFKTEIEAAIDYDNISEDIYGDRPNKTERVDNLVILRKFGSVCFCKKSNKYRVRVFDYSGKRKTIGYFVSKDEADEVLDLIRSLRYTDILSKG